MLIATAIAFIALFVSGFAARSMQGSSIPYARFFALLAAATAGSLSIAVASDLRVLAVAWVATGLFASGLLAVARGRSAARYWALRHFAIERIGDLAWIVILITTWRSYHTFDLTTLSRLAAPSGEMSAIATALVVAGIVRSAIVPFHEWLPNSMEAPTPVSAFLHAGVVNGAGILFAKTAPLIIMSPAALTIAAALGGTTAAIGATIALVRPEIKRRLGWSTVAQMGFMVVQCACGAFAAAVVHLVAHGGYKSSAFLGSASSIEYHRRTRLAPQLSSQPLHPARIALAALTPATLGVAVAIALTPQHIVELPASAVVLASAWAAGTVAARRCLERASTAGARIAGAAVPFAAVTAYLVCVARIDAWLGDALPHVTFAPVTAIVAAVFLTLGLLEGMGVRPPAPPALYTLALTEGRTQGLGAA